MIHRLTLESRTLHGFFSTELEPVVTVDSGDTVVFEALVAWWVNEDGTPHPARNDAVDRGHALTGPIAVRGARAGGTLTVHVHELKVGTWGVTKAYADDPHAEPLIVRWQINPAAGVARANGREVAIAPFLGIIGMPPPEPGCHSTDPPRRWGGNLDCKELAAGSSIDLPIPVDGAMLSVGDGHARQGDGEVSGTAIECPIERCAITIEVSGRHTEYPVAHADGATITFGFDESLDRAAEIALGEMLSFLRRRYNIDEREARALASVCVDLRITQIVNGIKGVHAIIRDDAIRETGAAP